MYLKENILLAIAGLRSNKMRALLTMLGIIIGIASVIAIVSVGNSMTNAVTSNMASMGANNVTVRIQQKRTADGGPMSNVSVEESDMMSIEQIEVLAERFEDRVEDISLSENVGSGQAKDGRLYANVSVLGVNPGYANVNNVDMTQGRFIMDRDNLGTRKVAVVSDKFVNNMFSGADPIGKEIRVTISSGSDTIIQTYSIIGVYKYEQSSFDFSNASDEDIRTQLYIPVNTAMIDAEYKNRFSSFTLMSKPGVDSIQLSDDVNTYFDKLYKNNPRWTYSSFSMESAISSLTEMLNTISIAVAVIAAISLLVGGIGVMNIMLVSVTERTREIGTRKALGAKGLYIRVQFIVESVIICAIGGIIGVVLGIALGAVGAGLLGYPAAVSVPIIIIAVGFAMVIGIFFGYYPASKAAKLDPIEALRYE